MDIFLNILVFLATIFFLVLVHEYGHFCAARLLGVKVERFSIGFGRALLKWSTKGGVEYVLAPIPLGGYVKLNNDSYNGKPVWRRMAIMLAGVIANIVLAIVIFWLMFGIGFKAPKPIIGSVLPQSIASQAGLRPGIKIKTVNGKSVSDWQEIVLAIVSRLGDKGNMTINDHKFHLISWKIDDLNPDPMEALGIKPYRPTVLPIIHEVAADSPAYIMGLQRNDRIVSVNDEKMSDWQQFIDLIHKRPKEFIRIKLLRGNKSLTLIGRLGSRLGKRWRRVGYLGVVAIPAKWPKKMMQLQKFSVVGAFTESLHRVWLLFSFNFILVSKIIAGKISLKVLGGPITIFSATQQAFLHGLFAYVGFLAILSIMLAFVNILPIPVLDGGNFLLLFYELIFHKSISDRAQFIVIKVGLIILATIIFIALGNDIMRLLF